MTTRRAKMDGSIAFEYAAVDSRRVSEDGLELGSGTKTGEGYAGEGYEHSPRRSEGRQIMLLVLLYLLQGVPTGLAFGSVPFLLKSRLSYAQVGIFSLASYPYSLKLLWSPVIDAVYWARFGRRKSWIVPVQCCSSLLLLVLGTRIDILLVEPEAHVAAFTAIFLLLIFLCSTQDIAVDGWALTLLAPENLSYASTAQTVGLNTGYFLSFTVFLAFNSPEFANKYFRAVPRPDPLLTLGGYLSFWGWARERASDGGLKSVYLTIWKILKLKHIQLFCIVLLFSKIGFVANDAITSLKLLEKGFSKEDLALTVLIDFPFEIIFGYYAAKWSNGPDPLRPWLLAFVGRLAAGIMAMLVVWSFPADGHVTKIYFLAVIIQNVFGSFMSTVQFVSICAFHTQIADPLIGGTYMTLLNTISNLGGTWPRILIFNSVDWFTKATCSIDVPEPTLFAGLPPIPPFHHQP
ncbi:putative membrane protein [Neolecta irregularis DAH-3]|uniref:Putative membrane protein n=1 Tax=Neolecta irregularis (strain DAH-3) TaxID=1198029 RepID=A0A1U7LLS7_NEOID|nr:putative membrane protein [Neolecta irregularis DAH-3]|eukprot:OLL23614.1 putative membrane protein [Neolecta irregularis DAH-3]